jgi:ABC-type branched-subunit amino acid transport system substrate-binding protein
MRTITTILVAAAMSFWSCTRSESVLSEKQVRAPKLKILVIGEGVQPDTGSERRIYPINRAEGFAMRQGVEWATNDPAVRRILDLVEFVYIDDFGRRDDAGKLARTYQMDPSVLAVIGHASSGTTLVASGYYEEANIPLLMPIATSPSIATRTAFRLPLNDSVGQAPALLSLIRDHLKLSRVYIVQDVGSDASFYTSSLDKAFRTLLPSAMFWGHTRVNLETAFADTVRVARENRAEVIVFIGYGSTAIRLLDAVNHAYARSPEAAPVVVLTDGCINLELRPGDAEVYLTAPLPDLRASVMVARGSEASAASTERVPAAISDSAALVRTDSTSTVAVPVVSLAPRLERSPQSPCDGEAAKRLRSRLQPEAVPNYHVFGYDAALILADGVAKCRDDGIVSRTCVREMIAESRELGVCTEYVFRNGENVNGAYYAYRLATVDNKLDFVPVVEFTSRALAEVDDVER